MVYRTRASVLCDDDQPGERPPVVPAAAQNPEGAESLARPLRDWFEFCSIVLGVL